jgi:3-oxoacyl-[acyl-carrier protein] reductase
MDLGLRDKTALVLASSSGLGRGVGERLAAEGARVVFTGRSEERLAECVEGVRARGGEASFVVADLAAPNAAETIHAAAVKAYGCVDVLVNNSGGPPPTRPSEIATEVWLSEFSKMVLPIFSLSRLVLGGMRAKRFGRIIALASSGVIEPIPNLPLSNALRLSIVGWMKSLSTEVAMDGVTVNVVAPGRIDTDRLRRLDAAAAAQQGRPIEEVKRASIESIPAGRYGAVEEFAAVVAFLAGAPASYVTGSIIRVDGGLLRSL